MEKLFTQALGLTSPWAVTSVGFSAAQGRIDFVVSCEANRLTCPNCGAADQPVHNRIERTWQHLNFFQFKAFIRAGVPRVVCGQCGKTGQVEAPWTSSTTWPNCSSTASWPRKAEKCPQKRPHASRIKAENQRVSDRRMIVDDIW